MVIDKVEGKCIPRYLAYDIIRFDNCDVRKLEFYPTRLSCIDVSIGKYYYVHNTVSALVPSNRVLFFLLIGLISSSSRGIVLVSRSKLHGFKPG